MNNHYKDNRAFLVTRPKGRGKGRKNKTQQVVVWRRVTIHLKGKKEEWSHA